MPRSALTPPHGTVLLLPVDGARRAEFRSRGDVNRSVGRPTESHLLTGRSANQNKAPTSMVKNTMVSALISTRHPPHVPIERFVRPRSDIGSRTAPRPGLEASCLASPCAGPSQTLRRCRSLIREVRRFCLLYRPERDRLE